MVVEVPQGGVASVHDKDGVMVEKIIAYFHNLTRQHGFHVHVFYSVIKLFLPLVLDGSKLLNFCMKRLFVRQCLNSFNELRQYGFCIADERNIRGPVQPDVGRFRINLNEALLIRFAEHGRAAPHIELSQTCANGKHHIGLAVCSKAGKACGMKTLGMGVGYNASGTDGVGHRASKVFGQSTNFVSGACAFGAITAVDIDKFRFHQHLCGFLDKDRVRRHAFRHPVLFGRINVHAFFITLFADDVFGDKDMGGSGPTG